MVVDELVAMLGYETKGEDKFRRFSQGMDRAAIGAKRMATAVVAAGAVAATAFAAVGAGMFRLAKEAAGPLDELVKFSDRVNVNIEPLQEWQFAAEQSGASSGEFQGALTTLSKNLAEVARGTGRAKLAFDDYGMSAKDANGNIKSADVVLAELAEKFKTLTDQQALDLGQKLGMTPGMITLLKSGTAEIDKLRKQARDSGLVFTEEEARNAERFNDSLNLFNRSIKAIRHRIGVEFLPVLADTIDSLQTWILENQALIRSQIELWTGRVVTGMRGFLSLIGRIGAAVDWVGGIIADMLRYISGNKINLDNWQGLLVFAGALAMAFKPALAAVSALFLLVDDLLTWKRGGKSVFGDILEFFSPENGATAGSGFADGFARGIKKLDESAGSLVSGIDWKGLGTRAGDAFMTGLGMLWDDLMSTSITFDWGDAGTDAGSKFGSAFFQAFSDLVTGFFNSLGMRATQAIQGAIGNALPDWLKDRNVTYSAPGNLSFPEAPPSVDRTAPNDNVSARPGETVSELQQLLLNAESNMARAGNDNAAASVESTVNDSRNQSVKVEVGGVTVTQAVQAPAAVGAAVGAAAASGARSSLPPSRISGGGGF